VDVLECERCLGASILPLWLVDPVGRAKAG
jgi:hypothetical protein